jgi:phosphoribosyl 1,2-cyclic phosphate phosphodiesterase
MMAKLTILGCGSSGGVPRIGPSWGKCDPTNPRNRRRRSSVLIERFSERGRTTALIDTSPDMREQLIDAGVSWLDGVVFTHDHADHTHGIDDLRMVSFAAKRRVDVYFDAVTREGLEQRFSYCFRAKPGSSYPPILQSHDLVAYETLAIDGKGGALPLLPLDQEHADMRSLGIRVGDVAYCSDVSAFPPRTLHHLQGLETLIIGALRHEPHPAHMTVRQALQWIERLRPRRAVLTHLHIDLDYETLRRELPDDVEPAYDGMEIEVRL